MALAIGRDTPNGGPEFTAVFKHDESLETVQSIAESIRKRGFEVQVFREVEWLYGK